MDTNQQIEALKEIGPHLGTVMKIVAGMIDPENIPEAAKYARCLTHLNDCFKGLTDTAAWLEWGHNVRVNAPCPDNSDIPTSQTKHTPETASCAG